MKLLNNGYEVHGIDNNARAFFFGTEASTNSRKNLVFAEKEKYTELNIDITNRSAINDLISQLKPFAIIHTAAQPSHDKAASIPFLDFETNAVGTLNLIESLRIANLDGIFIHMSTNKVYGDSPNLFPITEFDKRFDFSGDNYRLGIDEAQTIDGSMHSLFGVSKLSADILVQEYGRYFGMKTCVLRGGCLTGPNHKGVELHGFLSWLVKCNLSSSNYKIFGHKGKQVRDNLHSEDVANFINLFIESPRPAAVYNIGGGFRNSISVLEAIDAVEEISGIKMKSSYISEARKGDHIVYYSNLSKMRKDYPEWKIQWSLENIIESLVKNLDE